MSGHKTCNKMQFLPFSFFSFYFISFHLFLLFFTLCFTFRWIKIKTKVSYSFLGFISLCVLPLSFVWFCYTTFWLVFIFMSICIYWRISDPHRTCSMGFSSNFTHYRILLSIAICNFNFNCNCNLFCLNFSGLGFCNFLCCFCKLICVMLRVCYDYMNTLGHEWVSV